ncbi:MAG: hypothetical protein ABEJ69_02160 [Candidatus Nanohaloarchaea archaeon]
MLARCGPPPERFSTAVNPRPRKEVPTIDANTRDFETELRAQLEDTVREETEVHSDASVVVATTL